MASQATDVSRFILRTVFLILGFDGNRPDDLPMGTPAFPDS